ncbi:MAG: PepSY domain-containing protein [Thioalkalivibrionaceae bacterium]
MSNASIFRWVLPSGVLLSVAALIIGVGAGWQLAQRHGADPTADSTRGSTAPFTRDAGGRAIEHQTVDTAGLDSIEALVEQVQARYDAQLIDASLSSGLRHEQAPAVYELRFITAERNVLRIRFDASTGDWLEIDGRGQIAARRAADTRPDRRPRPDEHEHPRPDER